MKEVTYADWVKNPIPRKMWVWDNNENCKLQRKVIYFIGPERLYPVVALSDDEISTENFKHCAEIEKTRRMTYKEFSMWLRENPTREYRHITNDFICHNYDYKESNQNVEVCKDILIREDNGEWREPLVEEIE